MLPRSSVWDGTSHVQSLEGYATHIAQQRDETIPAGRESSFAAGLGNQTAEISSNLPVVCDSAQLSARLQEVMPALRIVVGQNSAECDLFSSQYEPGIVVLCLDNTRSFGRLVDLLESQRRCTHKVVCAPTRSLSSEQLSRLLAAGACSIIDQDDLDFVDQLQTLIQRMISDEEAQADEIRRLKRRFEPFGLVGDSDELLRALQQVERCASASHSSVLIAGETGTGKQLLAQAIHAFDPVRQDGPFHTLNCSAINDSLAESELFGHVRGAFTGAGSERPGAFQAADGGTLFLDEIGELKPELQPKLLLAVQDGRFLPIGDDRPRQVNVRVVAATNRSLKDMIQQRQFREDLYQRLATLQIDIPPLRERPDDVVPQTLHFLRQYQRTSAPIVELDPHVRDGLRCFPWRGNTRELENLVRQILINSPAGPVLKYESLPTEFHRELVHVGSLNGVSHGSRRGSNSSAEQDLNDVMQLMRNLTEEQIGLKDAIRVFEELCLRRILPLHHGNRTHAAKSLGISRRSLVEKIAKYGLGETAISSEHNSAERKPAQ